MIFKQIDAILNGTKTQTRRIVKDEHGWVCGRVNKINPRHPTIEYAAYSTIHFDNGRLKWARDKTYAIVPKRGAASIGKFIKIISIHREHLHDITEQDAQAEGVASVAEYKALWESINGKKKGARWADNPEVWVLEFELAKESEGA